MCAHVPAWPIVRERTLDWDGCTNVRDLGGHVTEDGRETRYGAVVRADSVRKLSGAGWEALVDYGISRIVDLRLARELEDDPSHVPPVEVVHVKVLDEDVPGAQELFEADGTTADFYLGALDLFHERWARAVAAVGAAPEGGVVVHCLGGKDRTGLVTAMLLRLVGVPVEDVAADYGLSAARLGALNDQWIADAPDERERERRRAFSLSEPQTMTETLAELDRRHGSVRDFLLAGGATEDELAGVRARLLG